MTTLKDDLLTYAENNPSDKSIKDKTITDKLDNLFLTISEGSRTKTRKVKAALVILELNEPPVCECGNKLEFVTTNKATYKSPFGGWREFCSSSCSRSSSTLVERRKETNVQRYGFDSWAKTDIAKEKSTKPWSEEKKEIYNVKRKVTNLQKRGVDHHSKTQEYLDKRSKTCLEKFGYENPFQDVERIKSMSIEKNGYYGWFSSPEGQEYLNNNNPANDPLITDKKRLSFYANRTHVAKEFCDIIYAKNESEFNNYIHKIAKLAGSNRKQIAEYVGISYSNLNYYMRIYNMDNDYLNVGKGTSFAEIKIFEFVKEICPDAIRGDRQVLKPKELDIYVPSKNLAIEHNGIYSHSVYNGGKDEHYHLYKTNECEKRGIQLLHIFEWEWEDVLKQEIWKSIIRHKLGVISNKIPARKCIFDKISTEQARTFYDENHLSGFCGAKYHFGLFHDNILVSALSLGKQRNDNESDTLEIIRFASLKNTIVIGALGKLLKNTGINNIMTFADRRYSSINSSCYMRFFEKMSITEVNWFGFSRKYQIPSSRWNYTKEKCKELFEYDDSLTCEQNMFGNNYDIIYDSGNLKFEGLII